MPMGDDLAQHSLEMTTNASRMALELLKLLADFARKRMEKNRDANSKYGEDNKIYKGALNIKKFNEVAEKHGGYSQQTISSQDVEAVMAEAKKLNIPINVRDLGNGNSAVCFLKQDSELFEQGLKNIVAEKLRQNPDDYSSFEVKRGEIEPLKREFEKNGISAEFVIDNEKKIRCLYEARDNSVMEAIKSDFKEKHEEIANNFNIEYNSERRSFRLTDGEKTVKLSKLPTEAKLNTVLQERFGYDEVSAALACKKFESALSAEQRKFFNIDTRQLEKIANFERNIKLENESPLLKDFSFSRIKLRSDNHNNFAVSNGDHVVHLIPDTMPRRSMEEEIRSKLGITDKAVITAIVDKSTTLNNKYKERDKEVNKDTPKMIGGKPQTIVAKPDEFQQAYIQQLAARSERIHNGSVDPSEDNMLRVTHEARLLGLDSRAINPEADDRPDSKVNLCIDNIMRIYNETSEQKGVQVVFCDIAVHADEEAGKWSVYDNIKQELIKRGMPESEICFAGDAKNQTERNEMYSQLRSGTKRLVIASTQKMGTGANIQDRLAALHHLDIPWKPSDLEQQNGRILRRGNQFEEVGIYHYVTEGTFDAYMLSIITAKQRFISQTMTGKTPARTCSDVDEMVLNYSEMQAIASGDPRIKEKIELDGDVAKLKMLEAEHYNNLYKLQDMIPKYEINISVDEELLKITKADLAQKQANAAKMPKDEFAGMVINGVKFDERVKAGAALRPIVQKAFIDGETQMIGSYGGFKIGIEKLKYVDPAPRFFLQSETGQKYFSSDAELASDTGNVQRIENVFKTAIEKRIEQTEARLEETKNNLEEARNADKTPFARAAELAEKSARLEQLNLELNVDKPDNVIAADDEELGNEEKAPEIEEHRNKPRR